jgi:hypothetical protein
LATRIDDPMLIGGIVLPQSLISFRNMGAT